MNKGGIDLKPKYVGLLRKIIFLAIDYLMVVIGVLCAYEIRLHIIPLSVESFHIKEIYLFLFIPLTYLTMLLITKSYGQENSLAERIRVIFKASLYSVVWSIILMYFGHVSGDVSRLFVGLSWLLSFISLVIGRIILGKLLKKLGLLEIPAVIIGAGLTAEVVLGSLQSQYRSRYQFKGYFDDLPIKSPILNQYSKLGNFLDISNYLHSHSIHTAFVMTPGLPKDKLNQLIKIVQPHVNEVIFVPDLIGLPVGNISIESFYNERIALIKVSNNLARQYNRILKRIFDLILAFILFIPVLIISLIVAIMIYKDSPGPVLYTQPRVGKGGKLFKCYKFRSMIMESDKVLKEYLSNNPEAQQEWNQYEKLKNDPRITPFGAFIRKLSIDELPQLINVIKGEMSIIGPRPIMDNQREKYGDTLVEYELVAPGITGLWQVSGRNETTFEQRVEMDSWYIRNWSIWNDLVILYKTIDVVIHHKGAY